MAGSTSPPAQRAFAFARSPLTLSAVLFAAIVALGVSAQNSERAGILLLLIGPIVIVSLAYRPLAGAAAATASLAAFLVAHGLHSGGLDVASAASRAFTFYAIPLAIWLSRMDQARRAAAELASQSEAPATTEPREQALTRREREVLGLIAAGHTNTEIASLLVLSVRTVESHRASVRRKLGRPSPAELVLHAKRWGVFPADHAAATSDEVPRGEPGAPGLVY
jgi:DNA-binding CsgD family transcriptional regulator